METRKCIYTVGHFVEELDKQYWGSLWELNIQSDEAIEIVNRCLPRNLMVKKLFSEDEEDISIMDAIK